MSKPPKLLFPHSETKTKASWLKKYLFLPMVFGILFGIGIRAGDHILKDRLFWKNANLEMKLQNWNINFTKMEREFQSHSMNLNFDLKKMNEKTPNMKINDFLL